MDIPIYIWKRCLLRGVVWIRVDFGSVVLGVSSLNSFGSARRISLSPHDSPGLYISLSLLPQAKGRRSREGLTVDNLGGSMGLTRRVMEMHEVVPHLCGGLRGVRHNGCRSLPKGIVE